MTTHPPARACPDCGTDAGLPHVDGCDVARCTACGWQRIGCDHEDSDVGWGEVWSGRWPGDAEVEEGLAPDLNELAMRAMRGEVAWNGSRWIKARDVRHGTAVSELEEHP